MGFGQMETFKDVPMNCGEIKSVVNTLDKGLIISILIKSES